MFHIAGHLLSRHSMAAARRIEVPGAEVKRGEHLRSHSFRAMSHSYPTLLRLPSSLRPNASWQRRKMRFFPAAESALFSSSWGRALSVGCLPRVDRLCSFLRRF